MNLKYFSILVSYIRKKERKRRRKGLYLISIITQPRREDKTKSNIIFLDMLLKK